MKNGNRKFQRRNDLPTDFRQPPTNPDNKNGGIHNINGGGFDEEGLY